MTIETLEIVGAVLGVALALVIVLGLILGGPAHPHTAWERGWRALRDFVRRRPS
jgi:hypothetical protein